MLEKLWNLFQPESMGSWKAVGESGTLHRGSRSALMFYLPSACGKIHMPPSSLHWVLGAGSHVQQCTWPLAHAQHLGSNPISFHQRVGRLLRSPCVPLLQDCSGRPMTAHRWKLGEEQVEHKEPPRKRA